MYGIFIYSGNNSSLYESHNIFHHYRNNPIQIMNTPRTDQRLEQLKCGYSKCVPKWEDFSKEMEKEFLISHERLEQENIKLKNQLTKDQGCVTISRNGYVQELEDNLKNMTEQRNALMEDIDNLLKVEGRHNTKIAYNQLSATYKRIKGEKQ